MRTHIQNCDAAHRKHEQRVAKERQHPCSGEKEKVAEIGRRRRREGGKIQESERPRGDICEPLRVRSSKAIMIIAWPDWQQTIRTLTWISGPASCANGGCIPGMRFPGSKDTTAGIDRWAILHSQITAVCFRVMFEAHLIGRGLSARPFSAFRTSSEFSFGRRPVASFRQSWRCEIMETDGRRPGLPTSSRASQDQNGSLNAQY